MKKIFFCILLSLFITLACQKNFDSITSPPEEDIALLKKISGTWSTSNSSYNITYYSNNTFIDSSFLISQDSSQSSKLKMIKKGNFKIENRIITQSDVHIPYIDTSVYNSLSIVPRNHEIEIISDYMLILKSVDVLKSESSNNNDIWGNWSIIKWTYHRAYIPVLTIYEGHQKYFYSFNPDSSLFEYRIEYLENSPWSASNYKFEFNYDNLFLDLIGLAEFNIDVQFKNGDMYWYYDTNPIEFFKIK